MRHHKLIPLSSLLAIVAAGPIHAQTTPSASVDAVAATEARADMTLRDGWRFRQDDTINGVEAPDFADADWQQVSVPHSWNRVGAYLPSVATRINTPEMIDKTMGVGWYRLRFTPDARFRGKRAWLEFDAASRRATIWLNGTLLGTHQGGYSRFRLDATKALRPGAPNVLVVKADNSKPATGSTTADILPLAGDFFVPGGLYRPVRLIATDPVHLDMLDAGGPGAYATTRAVSDGIATIDTRVRVTNDGRAGQALRVRTRMLSADGTVVASDDQPLRLAAGANGEARGTLTVRQAHLWQGVDDPYLHRLSVEILGANNRVLDASVQAFGIREMRIDPERGFFLNGKPYTLRGTGYHQDREDKGWAVDPSDVEADVKLLREMGATSIRLTHYQHGQAIHDLADRYGLVLWDEIPLVSAWTLGDSKQASDGLRANARQQLEELIRQNQNHASVVSWGIANEVDFGNSLPGFLSNFTGTPPDPKPLLSELGRFAKATDASRPTALATCCEGRLFGAGVAVPITAGAADLGGANRYFGWYYGKPDELGPHLDSLRAARPEQPLAVTEYGAGGALTIHTDNVLGGPISSRGRPQPEEYLSYVHERNWAVLATKPYLWATWLWVSFDFASTVRHEGDSDDINTKGLVAYDHTTRKDAFFFYKANWTTTPTVHLNGRRYVDRAYAVTDVQAYSNAPRTELLVNGVSAGSMSDCPQRACVWKMVRLKPGSNAVVARGIFADGTTTEDRLTWRLADDVAHGLRIDTGTMVAAKGASGRFGSDTFFDGGDAGTVIKPADYGAPAKPVSIAGTTDAEVAATYRSGDFRYRLPLADGRYTVTLSFIEPNAKPGERVFDVMAGGKRMLKALDLAQAGASASAAVQRRFNVAVRDGMLDLAFRPTKGTAIVSAIEVVPQSY